MVLDHPQELLNTQAGGLPLQSLIDAAPLAPIQILVVLLCGLVFITEGVDLNLIPLLAPAIAADWKLPTAAFSAIFSSGPVGLIIGGFTVGYFADRFGRRRALIGAMVLMTFATLATAATHDVPALLVSRVLTGIGFGGVIPASTALVSEFLPSRLRASAAAFVILGQSLGGLLAALFMKSPLGIAHWQTIILEVSGLCALTLALIVAFLPESPRYLLLRPAQSGRLKSTLSRLGVADTPAPPEAAHAAGARRSQVASLFMSGRALGTSLLWLTFVGVCWTVSFFTSWLTLIYTQAGKPAAAGITATSAYYLGGVVGGLVVPAFCARWTVNKVLMAAILAGAVSCTALGSSLHSDDILNLTCVFACGVFIPGAFYMLYPPVVGFYPTAIRSTGLGSAVAVGRVGNTLSPAAAGLMLGAGFLPETVFWTMAVPLVAALLAMFMFNRLTGGSDATDAVR